jgi:hypothetical protein
MPVTDEFMLEMRGKSRPYTMVLLKRGPNREMEGVDKIIWEHGRRNHELRLSGKMPIVMPIVDGGEINGLCIFVTGIEEATAIMNADPGVQAGVFTFEVHPGRSFPGDALPDPSA